MKGGTKTSDNVGLVSVLRNGEVVKEIQVGLKEDLDKMSYFDGVKKVLQGW